MSARETGKNVSGEAAIKLRHRPQTTRAESHNSGGFPTSLRATIHPRDALAQSLRCDGP
jgi:hypothetical protein